EGGFCHLEMGAHGRYHGDRVDVRRFQQLGRLCGDRQVRISVLDAFEGSWTLVTDRRHVTAIEATQVADDIWTPVAVADHADSTHRKCALYLGCGVRQPEMPRLIRAVTGKDCPRSAQKNLEVQPDRPRLRVSEVETDHVVEWNPASPIHLPEPGDARSHIQQPPPVPDVVSL